MKKTLLFVTYGGGHAHMVYPVVQALRGQDGLDIRVLGLPAAKAILNQHGVECFGFADYLDETKDADAIAWGRALAKVHHSPTIGVSLEDSIAYLGLNYKDLVARLGEKEAERQFAEKGRQCFFPLTIMERIFDTIQPDFVITTNSPRSEAAAIEIANTRGIDNLMITDLFTGRGDYMLKGKHITFLNAFAITLHQQDGLLDKRLSRFYCTGNPALDRILALPRDKDPGWVQRHFPQIRNKALILHADMPGYWDYPRQRSHLRSEAEIREELEACYQAARQNDAVYLVRPHPSQNRQFYAEWLTGRDNAFLAAEYPLHELLRNIDLLLARTTTVALEAVYMGKRVLQIDADFHADLPLAAMGVAWGINRYNELAEGVRSALGDDKKLAKIRNNIKQMLPDEPAASKIATIIAEKITA